MTAEKMVSRELEKELFGNFNSKELNSFGVYLIRTPSNKVYIGCTRMTFRERWMSHIKDIKSNKHHNVGLQRASTKYPLEQWRFEILKSRVKRSNSTYKKILLEEQEFWDYYSNLGCELYNGRPTGTGSVYPIDYMIDKIQHRFLGKIHDMYCIQGKTKMAISNELGINPGYILRIVKDNGLDQIRQKNGFSHNGQKNLTSLQKNQVKKLYVKDGLSQESISKELCINYHLINNFLHSVDARKLRTNKFNSMGHRHLTQTEKEQALLLYCHGGMGMTKISRHLSVSAQKIRNLIIEADADRMRVTNGFKTGLKFILTEEQKVEILDLSNSSLSISSISRQTQLPYYNIRQYLHSS
jgi:transposase-like protein/predicted GIY-YIG superfamily endonuclease